MTDRSVVSQGLDLVWGPTAKSNEENLGGDENVSDSDFNAGCLGVFSCSKFLEGYI